MGKKLDALRGHVGNPKNLCPKSLSKTCMRVKLKEASWCWELVKERNNIANRGPLGKTSREDSKSNLNVF